VTDESLPASEAAPVGAVPAEVQPPEADVPPEVEPPPPADDGDVALLGLIDRLARLLDRSDLIELEVEAGGTALVLRTPAALVPTTAPVAGASAAEPSPPVAVGPDSGSDGGAAGASRRPSVKAPLTGIFYASPAPGSAPYVQVGGEVAVGQVIGLIEAMKLFNEIKSDLAGRVVRVLPESGTLVKAKQPLVEVDPL
jgi:acetyl-CoA carboxylase biotin carboxyl carrier protein